ncbi:CD209 antigen-like protein E [Gymnodraco acuticeps]|uniref:CD209 antigen-like protein E n=1 Tax=Gymnodraco acuticeps TaxID=8218 RepID=A0A6P8T9B5_GYMAC|nr:CD209 antigen-like protein E [Gymnodraco acuticeps]
MIASGGAAADLSTVKANLTEHLQASDQLINQLKANLTEKTREVDKLQCLMGKGWRKFGCSFYLLSTEKASWQQSRQNCRAGGTDLVIVDSYEEQEFINSVIKEDTWIGLNDTEKEGTWKWVDGSPLNLTFWSTGQPDNRGGYPGEEDCAEIRIVYTKRWNDRSCEFDLLWICEKEA